MPAQGKVEFWKPNERRAAPEVIVVGAGVIGLSIGWRLAQRGVRTLVLDAGRAGERRDRRRGRDARPGHRGRLRRGGADRAQPRRPAAAGPRSRRSCRARAGIDCGYRRIRHAERSRSTATTRRCCARLHELSALAGPRRAVALRPRVPPPGARSGARASPAASTRRSDHQVSPRLLAQALAAALAAAGGELRSGARVARLASRGGRRRGRAGAGRRARRRRRRDRGRRGVRRARGRARATRACRCGR